MTRTAALDELIPADCASCSSRGDGMCATLSTLELRTLAKAARQMTACPGEVLFDECEPMASYASLSSGMVKLVRTLADGRQQIVGLQFAPSLIGNFGGHDANVTVEAVGAVSYCRIPRPALDSRRAENPQLEAHLMTELLVELETARADMLALGRMTARERVSGFLFRIRGATGAAFEFDLPLTRADMADYLGLTLETVSRQLSALKRDRIINLPHIRKVQILDLDRLEAAAGV